MASDFGIEEPQSDKARIVELVNMNLQQATNFGELAKRFDALKVELKEAKAHEIEAWDAKSAQGDENWKFIENLKSERDAALAQVGELGARLEEAEDVLRAMASYVGNGGYNADTVDPKVFEAKIREGIDFIIRVEVNRALSDADTRAHAWWAHTGPHKSLREAIHNGTPAWVRGTEEARKRGAEHGE